MMAATLMAFACPTAVCAAFDCAPTHCTQITSCAEARYKLLVCGHSARDADNDGIPCENLCGDDRESYEARSLAQWPKMLPFAASPTPTDALRLIPPAYAEPLSTEDFSCSGKKRCSEMISCAEAQFY